MAGIHCLLVPVKQSTAMGYEQNNFLNTMLDAFQYVLQVYPNKKNSSEKWIWILCRCPKHIFSRGSIQQSFFHYYGGVHWRYDIATRSGSADQVARTGAFNRSTVASTNTPDSFLEQ